MDKAILKKFAVESRKDLMEKIKNKINTFYIDEEFKKEQKGEIYVLSNEKHSLSLTNEEYQKRELLIKRIKELSLEQVIEEAAYTWFNRIIAIRYMEINDYLPLTKDNQSLGIRVLSSKDNTPDPAILKFTNLMNPDLDIDFKKEKYVELKDDNEKFKYVLLLVCKKLGRVIPQVFDGTTDYIDILIPDNLLNDTGFITKIINEVPEDNYNQVEIIGWLYQYYISEKKDEVFANLKKSQKINKENVPAATQLFTPNWVVKYLVENSLGRTLLKYDSTFVEEMEYYVKNEDDIIVECNNFANLKFLDPCCGSGHILVYAFELLYKFYVKMGYNKNSICKIIIENNIYGLDLDDRACQLSILSLALKARKYDRNLFSSNLEFNIFSIQESNNISETILNEIRDEQNKEIINYIINKFMDAKEYGSIIEVESMDYKFIIDKINQVENIFSIELKNTILPLIKQAILLSEKYDVVVTNPPYMGNKGMSIKLFNYIKKNYNDSKMDLFSVFVERCKIFSKNNGYYAMITQPSIVTLSSFEKLRNKIIDTQTIISLIHMGRGIFGVDFGSVAFAIKNCLNDSKQEGTYFRLYQRTFQYIESEDIENIFKNANKYDDYKFNFYKYSNTDIDEDSPLNVEMKVKFTAYQQDFKKIPTSPFAYWCSKSLLMAFENNKLVDFGTPRQGLATTDNNKFLRYWYEIEFFKCKFDCSNTQEAAESKYKWFPIIKGGDYRKWYGNRIFVVDYYNDGEEMKKSVLTKYPYLKTPNFVIKNSDYYFKEGITWSTISSKKISMRINPSGSIFETKGAVLFPYNENYTLYFLGLLNSKVADSILDILCPTMDFHEGPIGNFPTIIDENIKNDVDDIVKENINIMKNDWDTNEISWNFKKLFILAERENNLIKESVQKYINNQKDNFIRLKHNEEKLNNLFINSYNLENELNNLVANEDVSLNISSEIDIIKSLISYAVGCMFGRYSLDKEGLIYAGGDFDEIYKKCKKTDGGWAGVSLSNYKVLNDNGQEIVLSFEVDNDNVIPITDEAYFSDDIVERFKTFISVVYGEKTLNENLDFIAETLGKKGTETSEDTIRRYFVNDFFNDHVKTYQKRPIYWLFDSGKKNGFKALVYMHRYNENLIPKVRLDYLHRMQTTYEKLLTDVNDKLTSELSMTDKKEAQKRQADLNAKLQEIREYDEKIAHIANQRISIDLDDGVKVNYDKFKDILAKIK